MIRDGLAVRRVMHIDGDVRSRRNQLGRVVWTEVRGWPAGLIAFFDQCRAGAAAEKCRKNSVRNGSRHTRRTGGLIARAYIQSGAYGQGGLQTIDDLVFVGVPQEGVGQSWNVRVVASSRPM